MPPRHPLDPLTSDEINQACALLKDKCTLESHHRFVYVMNEEPPQAALENPEAVERIAFICVLDAKHNETFEARVNLSTKTVLSWEKLPFDKPPYGQAPLLPEEATKCEAILKRDPTWRAAMKRRALDDAQIDLLQIDSFSAGYYNIENEKGKRLVRATSYYRDKLTDNAYARPIEGVIAVVDLTAETIIKLEDDGKNTPIPKAVHNYDRDSIKELRPALKPLNITQPEGPSFTVDGWNIEWENWKVRLGFTQREGLVLHTVTYNDEGRDRPILHRASVTEMLVPYADPNPSHFFKAAFDGGENGFGRFANQLTLGCDCKGHIRYFDVPMADANGNATTLKNAICLHEQDAGVAWKHYEHRSGVYETRRARKLVISFATSIDNYTYIFYWKLTQDGKIGLKVALTGIVQTATTKLNASYKWGTKLTPELAAPMHQHLFNVRLHTSIDGPNNIVSQNEFGPLPISEENPDGIEFDYISVALKSEAEAACKANAAHERSWKVSNPSFLNAVGEPTAYKIDISESPLLLANELSSIYKRAIFATKHFWVTQYDPTQKYASGDYPNQHAGGDGLPKFIENDRSIYNKPLTLWITAGTTHKPRTEDFPAMPVKKLKLFEMSPSGFFKHNPTMGLPIEKNDKSVDDAKTNCCGTQIHPD